MIIIFPLYYQYLYEKKLIKDIIYDNKDIKNSK